jgi:acetylornithine deacetylase/succinyl-diaminopimelate desuccinylase-like protein
MHRFRVRLASALFGALCCAAQAQTSDEAAFRDLYRELVETNTTLSSGSCTQAVQAMAARLRTAGIPEGDMQILAPAERPKDGALIAILRGREPRLKPILLLAHVDVVEARREDWARDPFKLIEENGFFYARGASDDKAMAAVFTDTLVRYRREGYRPRRDIKLALTCGEETPETFNSVYWLLQTKPELLQAQLALNEGAGGELDAQGRPLALQIQAGEKIYQDYALETSHPGGHSSRPVKDNAIYRLAAGLSRLSAYQFPISLNPATRGYFEQQSKLVAPGIGADMRAVLERADDSAAERLWAVNPGWNSMLRTTCVATLIEGGHAPNALPQRARANVNCRMLPGSAVEDVRQQLVRVLADEGISVTAAREPGTPAPAPPLTPRVLDPVRQAAAAIWPGVPVVPTMATGATDGRFLNAAGIPTYGLSGMFHDAEGSHAHGLDERIRVQSLLDGRRFLYQVVRLYAEQKD